MEEWRKTLFFNPFEDDAFDDLFLEEEEHDHHGEDGDDGAGHEEAETSAELAV